MLRWVSSVAPFAHTQNEDICVRYGIAPIMEQLRERSFRWYVHVICAKENFFARIDLTIDIGGKRPKGRPKQQWLDTLDGDLKASRLHPGQEFGRIKYRNRSWGTDPVDERDSG